MQKYENEWFYEMAALAWLNSRKMAAGA